MPDLKAYLNIVNLLIDTEKELGLKTVTESDRVIFILFWQLSNSGKKTVTATFEELAEQHCLCASRAQFYKTITKAKKLGLIEQMGSPRSATYKWVG